MIKYVKYKSEVLTQKVNRYRTKYFHKLGDLDLLEIISQNPNK